MRFLSFAFSFSSFGYIREHSHCSGIGVEELCLLWKKSRLDGLGFISHITNEHVRKISRKTYVT
jgi:hypothetical protein